MNKDIEPFKVVRGPHGQPAIFLHGATREQHWFLLRAVGDRDMRSPFYHKKQPACPFIQGGSDLTEGYIYVEFWSNSVEAELYVDWLNDVYDTEVALAVELGLID